VYRGNAISLKGASEVELDFGCDGMRDILKKVVGIVSGLVRFIPEVVEIEKMSTTELYVFLFIGSEGRTINSVLSKVLGISRPSVSIATKSLLKKGLIEMHHDEDDRRFVYISLSQSGKATFDKFLDAFGKVIARVLSKLSESEATKLNESFEMLVKFVDSINSLES